MENKGKLIVSQWFSSSTAAKANVIAKTKKIDRIAQGYKPTGSDYNGILCEIENMPLAYYDMPTLNKQIFQKSLWEKIRNSEDIEIRLKQGKNFWGESFHGDDLEVKFPNVANKVRDFWIADNNMIIGNVAIPDTPMGHIVYKLSLDGVIGCSSRGWGNLIKEEDGENEIVCSDNYYHSCWDWVTVPAVPNAAFTISQHLKRFNIQEPVREYLNSNLKVLPEEYKQLFQAINTESTKFYSFSNDTKKNKDKYNSVDIEDPETDMGGKNVSLSDFSGANKPEENEEEKKVLDPQGNYTVDDFKEELMKDREDTILKKGVSIKDNKKIKSSVNDFETESFGDELYETVKRIMLNKDSSEYQIFLSFLSQQNLTELVQEKKSVIQITQTLLSKVHPDDIDRFLKSIKNKSTSEKENKEEPLPHKENKTEERIEKKPIEEPLPQNKTILSSLILNEAKEFFDYFLDDLHRDHEEEETEEEEEKEHKEKDESMKVENLDEDAARANFTEFLLKELKNLVEEENKEGEELEPVSIKDDSYKTDMIPTQSSRKRKINSHFNEENFLKFKKATRGYFTDLSRDEYKELVENFMNDTGTYPEDAWKEFIDYTLSK